MRITPEAHAANLSLQEARRNVVESAQMYLSEPTDEMRMVLAVALVREASAALEFYAQLDGEGRRETDNE